MNVPPLVNAGATLLILILGLVAGLAAATSAANAQAGTFTVLTVLAAATMLAGAVDGQLGDSDAAVRRRAVTLGVVAR